MDVLGPEIGVRGRVLTDPFPQALELALPNVGQPLSLGARGRPGIEIDGNAELVRGALTQAPRQGHAVLHRHIAHGHERHHVRRTHAGVLAPVLRQIDALCSDAHAAQRGFDRGVGARDQREHRAVVRRIGLHVE